VKINLVTSDKCKLDMSRYVIQWSRNGSQTRRLVLFKVTNFIGSSESSVVPTKLKYSKRSRIDDHKFKQCCLLALGNQQDIQEVFLVLIGKPGAY
jgi:hypothetical protein